MSVCVCLCGSENINEKNNSNTRWRNKVKKSARRITTKHSIIFNNPYVYRSFYSFVILFASMPPFFLCYVCVCVFVSDYVLMFCYNCSAYIYQFQVSESVKCVYCVCIRFYWRVICKWDHESLLFLFSSFSCLQTFVHSLTRSLSRKR